MLVRGRALARAGVVSLCAVVAVVSAVVSGVAGCGHELEVELEADGQEPIDTLDNVDLQGVYDCSERSDTGYRQGGSFGITVVTVDGRPVERGTANAYLAMQAAAQRDGVAVRIVSGFRTMSEQEYFYGCYVNCSCNSCNLAARPGYSNHQSGHALDLNTSSGSVLTWLNNNGARFGFSRTVPSEAWHWEWWGNPADFSGPCGGDARCLRDPDFGGCEGSVVTRCDENLQVGSGDCGFFGARCSTAGGTPHCVHPQCTAELGAENGTFCRDATILATCTDGAITEGDCGFFGAGCSEEGGQGHCVHPQCPINLDGQENGSFCVAGTEKIATCALGQYSDGDCAAYGGRCAEAGATAHCVHFLCWSNLDGAEDGSFCLDDGSLVTCAAGVPTIQTCSDVSGTCDEASATRASCSVPGAPEEPVPSPIPGAPGTLPGGTDDDEGEGPSDETVDAAGDDGGDRSTRALPASVQGGCGCAQAASSDVAGVGLLLVLLRRRRRRPPPSSTASCA